LMVICLFLKFLLHLTTLHQLYQTLWPTGLHSYRELFKSGLQTPTETSATLTGFFHELPRFIQTKARRVQYYIAQIFRSKLLLLQNVKFIQFTLYKLGTW